MLRLQEVEPKQALPSESFTSTVYLFAAGKSLQWFRSCNRVAVVGVSCHPTLQGGMDLEQLAIAHTSGARTPTAALDPILRHPLQLQSAYMEVTGAEPAFTSSHNRFHGTVDYIWYTPQVSLSSCHYYNILISIIVPY